MTLEQVFLALLGFCCGALGWFARELYTATQKLRQDLLELEVRITRDYPSYDRLREAFAPIVASLEEIKDSLRHKVDRT